MSEWWNVCVCVCYLSNLNSRQSLCIGLSQVQLVLGHVELLNLVGSVHGYDVLKEDDGLLEKVGTATEKYSAPGCNQLGISMLRFICRRQP